MAEDKENVARKLNYALGPYGEAIASTYPDVILHLTKKQASRLLRILEYYGEAWGHDF